MKLIRTDSSHKDFVNLVKELDSYLKIVDGDDHDFYNQYNYLDDIKHVVVIYEGEEAVACGAFKQFDEESVEVKRMFVKPSHRRKGLAKKVLQSLEDWAYEIGVVRLVLETGKRQIEAVSFYNSFGYRKIPNYGQYKKMENSVCFEKLLR